MWHLTTSDRVVQRVPTDAKQGGTFFDGEYVR